ncbi:MAG: hypothetical protein LBF81_06815, partial [Prevotellaceae bacterium]|nr:hypothetical protein [Prevotellaceae bacterium]
GGSSGSTGIVQGICPSGWLLPIRATYNTLATSVATLTSVGASLRGKTKVGCTGGTDFFGFASIVAICNGTVTDYDNFYTNDAGREDGFILDYDANWAYKCGAYKVNDEGECHTAVVRCFRQL